MKHTNSIFKYAYGLCYGVSVYKPTCRLSLAINVKLLLCWILYQNKQVFIQKWIITFQENHEYCNYLREMSKKKNMAGVFKQGLHDD